MFNFFFKPYKLGFKERKNKTVFERKNRTVLESIVYKNIIIDIWRAIQIRIIHNTKYDTSFKKQQKPLSK